MGMRNVARHEEGGQIGGVEEQGVVEDLTSSMESRLTQQAAAFRRPKRD